MHFRVQLFPEIHFGGISDAIDQAFSAVIPSGIPFGIAFSGGIDSGLILAWCLKKGLKPTIFSVRFAENSSGYSDTRAVEEIAEKFGLDICWVESEDADFRKACSCPAEAGPLVADSAYVLTRKIAESARRRNLRVLLSGAGADEWFGGYRRHAFFRRWLSIEDKIPDRLLSWALSALKPGKLRWSGAESGSAEELWQAAVSSSLSTSLREGAKIPLPAGKAGLLDQMIRWDQQHYLPGDVLWMTDMAGMAFGIETRFPFLHPSITGYADSIPLSRRMGRGRKEMLSELFSQHFGRKLAGRSKQGFGISAPDYLSHPETLKELIAWMDEISSKLPDLWNETALAEFREAALKNPSAYLQEWLSLGRLASWLKGFRK
jgi:asparagine synthase (glutamine-hydrolysing)